MNYGDIKAVDIANGTGIRVSLFVSGCSHKCKGCFNPELWSYGAGEPFSNDVKKSLLDLCEPNYISGLSVLGGEPLDEQNLADVTRVCKEFKGLYPNKTIWLYTGFIFDDVKHYKVFDYVDICVDGEFVEELKNPSLKFRGSSNQRIIEVAKYGCE